MRTDKTAAAPKPAPPPAPLERYVPPEPPEPPKLSPEELADQAEWDAFLAADVETKIEIFTTRLASHRLDAEDAFEAYFQIRARLDPLHDPAGRARLCELIDRLRRAAPESYHDGALYLYDLILFASMDERWEALPDPLTEFAGIADRKPDEFARVIELLRYHGQTQPLLTAMASAWPRVAQSQDIVPWGIDKFYGTMVELATYRYVETNPAPHSDDPAALPEVESFGRQPTWNRLNLAIARLSAAMPASWSLQDFGATVDAETWEHNLSALLFDWMADQRRRAGVPLSKSALFQRELLEILHQQLAEPASQFQGRRGRFNSKRAPAARADSPLIPRYPLVERALVGKFQFLSSQPYEAGALVEFLPAYLHYVARLGLMAPAVMDAAFSTFKPLVGQTLELLDGQDADPHLLRALELAWSGPTLAARRDDPDLAAARALPVAAPAARSRATPPAQTYRFRVTYRRADDVWFDVQTSSKHTLHDLHVTIMEATNFDDDHLHAFYLSGKAWDKRTEYGHTDARNVCITPIGSLSLRLKQRLLYIFDFGDRHEFTVQLIETSPEPARERYPRIVARHGKMPPQYPDAEDELDEDEDEFENGDEIENEDGDEGDDEQGRE